MFCHSLTVRRGSWELLSKNASAPKVIVSTFTFTRLYYAWWCHQILLNYIVIGGCLLKKFCSWWHNARCPVRHHNTNEPECVNSTNADIGFDWYQLTFVLEIVSSTILFYQISVKSQYRTYKCHWNQNIALFLFQLHKLTQLFQCNHVPSRPNLPCFQLAANLSQIFKSLLFLPICVVWTLWISVNQKQSPQ